MKFVDDATFVAEQEKMTICIGRTGQQVETDKEKVFAKAVVERDKTLYYIAFYGGTVYDPLGAHSNREYYVDMKFRKVSKDTYDFYTLYLQTNNQVYMTRAQRGAMDE